MHRSLNCKVTGPKFVLCLHPFELLPFLCLFFYLIYIICLEFRGFFPLLEHDLVRLSQKTTHFCSDSFPSVAPHLAPITSSSHEPSYRSTAILFAQASKQTNKQTRNEAQWALGFTSLCLLQLPPCFLWVLFPRFPKLHPLCTSVINFFGPTIVLSFLSKLMSHYEINIP